LIVTPLLEPFCSIPRTPKHLHIQQFLATTFGNKVLGHHPFHCCTHTFLVPPSAHQHRLVTTTRPPTAELHTTFYSHHHRLLPTLAPSPHSLPPSLYLFCVCASLSPSLIPAQSSTPNTHYITFTRGNLP